MTKTTLTIWLVVAFILGATTVRIVVPAVQDAVFGATIARTTVTNPYTFSSSTIMNGNLTVTTTNTATSSLIVGCWQFYATSTATPQKYQASTTPGIMYSSYGSCPVR